MVLILLYYHYIFRVFAIIKLLKEFGLNPRIYNTGQYTLPPSPIVEVCIHP
jgi:hypothetical protein